MLLLGLSTYTVAACFIYTSGNDVADVSEVGTAKCLLECVPRAGKLHMEKGGKRQKRKMSKTFPKVQLVSSDILYGKIFWPCVGVIQRCMNDRADHHNHIPNTHDCKRCHNRWHQFYKMKLLQREKQL